jgi:hypothetical protein
MQQLELRNAFTVETDHLGVDVRITFDPRRIVSNAWIAIRPIRPVHRVEPHPAVAGVDLQPVAIVLEFVHPAGTGGWPLGYFRLARRNETSRHLPRPAARGTPTSSG